MSAFGRGRGRTLLRSGLSAVAIAFAASLACAADASAASSAPEAPPSFGDLADASPLRRRVHGAGARHD